MVSIRHRPSGTISTGSVSTYRSNIIDQDRSGSISGTSLAGWTSTIIDGFLRKPCNHGTGEFAWQIARTNGPNVSFLLPAKTTPYLFHRAYIIAASVNESLRGNKRVIL